MSDQDETFLHAIRDFFNIGDDCIPVLIAVAWAEPMQDDPNGIVMHASSTPRLPVLENNAECSEVVKHELKKLYWTAIEALEQHITLTRRSEGEE